MDFSKMRTSDWVVAGSAIVLLISSFLAWFSFDLGVGGSVDANGWDVGFMWCILPVLIGLAMAAVVAIRAMKPETKLPELPIGWGQALFFAGCFAAFWVLLKLLLGEEFWDRAYGLFIASLAAIGLAVGGFLQWQEEKRGVGPATGTTPPQPF